MIWEIRNQKLEMRNEKWDCLTKMFHFLSVVPLSENEILVWSELYSPASRYICWPELRPQIGGVLSPVLALLPWHNKGKGGINVINVKYCCVVQLKQPGRQCKYVCLTEWTEMEQTAFYLLYHILSNIKKVLCKLQLGSCNWKRPMSGGWKGLIYEGFSSYL